MPVDPQLIMLKLEGGRMAAQTPFLAGKTFTVLKSSSAVGGGGKWLFLQPVGDAAGAAKDIVTLKVQGGATQTPWLIGKTFTIGKAPLMAGTNASKYLVLHPVTGLAGKGAMGVAAAAKGVVPVMKTAAFQAAAVGAAPASAVATAGKAAAVSTLAKSGLAAGTIWIGSGIGLGAASASPMVLGALIIATGVGIYQYRKKRDALSDDDEEISDALLS